MIHSDNSVALASRSILKLYNINQERILLPFEIQFLTQTFQTLLQNRIGTKNEITITEVKVDAQSFIFGEDVPMVEMVLTIYGRYAPPPEIHFSNLVMEEFGDRDNLIVYRNQLMTGSDYFSRLHDVDVSEYKKVVSKKVVDTTIEESKHQKEAKPKKKSGDGTVNHYQYNTQSEEQQDKKEADTVQDVSAKSYYGNTSTNNYSTLYNVDDGTSTSHNSSLDTMQNIIAFMSILSFIGIVLFGIIYTRRKRRSRISIDYGREEVGTYSDSVTAKRVTFSSDVQSNRITKQRSMQNAKKVLVSSSIASNSIKISASNNGAGYSGVTDVELKEKKDISFRGVMDIERDNHSQLKQQQEEQKMKEHETYVSSLL